MKLKNINEIKEEGLKVFMPSGIQATLFNEGKDIIVQYYNLREDKYSLEEFNQIINEGIEIFDEPVSIPSQSALMESFKEKGFITHKLNEEIKKVSLEELIGKTEKDFEHHEDIVDYLNKETDWGTIGFGGAEIDVQNMFTGEVATIILKEVPPSRYVVEENTVFDSKTGDGLEVHNGFAIRIKKDLDETEEKDLSVESSLHKSTSKEDSETETTEENDVKDKEKTKIEIEIKDDKVEIEGELNGKEFEIEKSLEESPESEELETRNEADENGDNTIKSFFGLDEINFKSKKDLIKHIQENTDYDVVSSDNLTLIIKDRTNPNSEEIALNLKHEMKEWYQPDNIISEGYDQKNCKQGDIYKALKAKKKEYLTTDYKLELLISLDKISREYPDVKVRHQAREFMDELGLQEYWDTKAIEEFIKENLKVLNKHVNESLTEENHNYIEVKGQKVELNGKVSEWLDEETFYLRLPSDGLLTDEDGTKFFLNCEYHLDLDDFAIDATFVDDEEQVIEALPLDKANSYISMNDKELIMQLMNNLMDVGTNKNLKEALNGIDNICEALQRGEKEGFEPIEYGNWKCVTSLDNKWEKLSKALQNFILNEISYQVAVKDLKYDDLEVLINYDDCQKAEMDLSDLKELEMFDEEEIEDMINNEFKPLKFLLSYNIEFDKKLGEDYKMKKANKKALKENKKISKKLKEEYGEYKGDPSIEEIGNSIEDGNQYGYEPYEFGHWTLEAYLEGSDDLFSRTSNLTDNMQDYLAREISYPVKDGHISYSGLDIIIHSGCGVDKEDLLSLDPDHNLFDEEDIDKMLADEDGSTEIEFWVDYEVKYDEDVEMEDDDDLPEEEVEEFCVVLKDGREEWFDGQDTADNYFEDHKADVSQYYRKVYKVKGGEVVEDSSSDEVIYQDLDEQFKLKDKKKKLDEKTKGVKAMKKTIKENVYKVYNTLDKTECGTFNSWGEVEKFLDNEWGTYSTNLKTENPDFVGTCHKDDFLAQYEMDIVQVPNIEKPEQVEVVAVTTKNLVGDKAELTKETCPSCGKEECECEKCSECGCNPCQCEKEITEDVEDATEETNPDIEKAKETDEYVEVPGVTADPEKAEINGDTLIFTPKETEVLNALEPGEKILLPNEQPDGINDYEKVGTATEIIKADMEDQSGTKEEIVSNDSIDDFIAMILSDEDEEPVVIVEEPVTCPKCGKEVCVCEQNECMQPKPTKPKKEENKVKERKEKIKEGLDTFEDEELEYEFRTVRKNALANPNAYEGRYTQKDIKQARQQYADDIKAKNEAFKDNMGMLTDINELDFPDALQKAVDTKEDGSLYRISDIAKEVEELKTSLKQEIENIKNDIKASLTDIKQDIKDDVKDIQTNVVSKLDNTDSKIAELTSEEEDLDVEDVDLEAEEEPTSTEDEVETEQTTEPEMTEAERKLFVKQLVQNPMYEQIKDILRTSKLEGKKMSINTISEKLREDYGVNTKHGYIRENVEVICEYTPLNKYIIDEDTEKVLLKKANLGIANKYIKTGLETVWANRKKEENYATIQGLVNQSENLDQAKKAIDKLANKDGNAEKIKKAIDLTTDNEQEKEQAIDYAVDKIDEKLSLGSLLRKGKQGALSSITLHEANLDRLN